MRIVIGFLIIQHAALIVCFAQGAPSKTVTTQTLSCNKSDIAKVERAYKRRKKEFYALRYAENAVKNLVASCQNRIDLEKFQKQLTIVEEEMALRHFGVAQFYLLGHTRGGLNGAINRLKLAYNNYPHFSKRAEVIYMLGDLSMRSGKEEEARKYYRSVVSEFPKSNYAEIARQKLGTDP